MKQKVSLKRLSTNKGSNYQLLALVAKRLAKEYHPLYEFTLHSDGDEFELYTFVLTRDMISYLREDVKNFVKELKPYF